MYPVTNEAPKRSKLRQNAFSDLLTLLRNIKTLLEATHDIAQRRSHFSHSDVPGSKLATSQVAGTR
jgi:hypothetical protein